jgi:hypothetical protein
MAQVVESQRSHRVIGYVDNRLLMRSAHSCLLAVAAAPARSKAFLHLVDLAEQSGPDK